MATSEWTLHGGRLNTYSFHFRGKQVIIHPLPPNRGPSNSTPPTKTTLLVDYYTFYKDIDDNNPVFCHTSALDIPMTETPPEIATLLEKYGHLCKEPLVGTLLPFRTIQHRTQLQPGASLLNLPLHRMAL